VRSPNRARASGTDRDAAGSCFRWVAGISLATDDSCARDDPRSRRPHARQTIAYLELCRRDAVVGAGASKSSKAVAPAHLAVRPHSRESSRVCRLRPTQRQPQNDPRRVSLCAHVRNVPSPPRSCTRPLPSSAPAADLAARQSGEGRRGAQLRSRLLLIAWTISTFACDIAYPLDSASRSAAARPSSMSR
jgi:hypothetical protein